MSEDRFLLHPAEGDIDADDALTKLEILKMLADDLGYIVTSEQEQGDACVELFEIHVGKSLHNNFPPIEEYNIWKAGWEAALKKAAPGTSI